MSIFLMIMQLLVSIIVMPESVLEKNGYRRNQQIVFARPIFYSKDCSVV